MAKQKEKNFSVQQAIAALSLQCDGAVTRDRKGFSAVHTHMGRYLGQIPFENWPEGTESFVYHHVLPVYTNQLATYGIPFDEIQVPPVKEGNYHNVGDLNYDLRRKVCKNGNGNGHTDDSFTEEETEESWAANNRIEVDSDSEVKSFAIYFDYNPALVNDVRLISGAKFNGITLPKHWSAPLSRRDDVISFGEKHNLHITDEARAIVPPVSDYLKWEEDHVQVHFDYDPAIVRALKEMVPRKSRKFHSKEPKHWRVTLEEDGLAGLLQFCHEFEAFQADIPKLKTLHDKFFIQSEAKAALSMAIKSDSIWPELEECFKSLKGTLRPFQKVGVQHVMNNQRVLISDDMGVGKTIEALSFLHCAHLLFKQGHKKVPADSFPALVVCPAVVKYNWAKEMRSWLPDDISISIVANRKKPVSIQLKDGSEATFPFNDFNADILIINYDILKRNMAKLLPRNHNTIILDESHNIKEGKSQRTLASIKLGEDVTYRIELSGTPILNRPFELVSQLEFLNRLDDIGGFWTFVTEFCEAHRETYGWNFDGASNMEKLHKDLRRSGIYLRRTKEQVLTELPGKQRTTIPLELDSKGQKEYVKALTSLVQWVYENSKVDAEFKKKVKKLPKEQKERALQAYRAERAERAKKNEHLVKIGVLQRLAAQAKMEALIEWVEDFLKTGEKLVLFGIHQEPINLLAKHFDAPTITGEIGNLERQRIVDRFQNDPECNLLIGNIKAAGVGITLTAASNVAFFELYWNNALHDQAEDRCLRMGQKNSVNCWYLVSQNTIEDEIARLIEAKRNVTGAVIDGLDAQVDEKETIGNLTKYLMAEAAKLNKRMAKIAKEWEAPLFF